jgi:outer membrane receptor protein involved in Fe transport
VAWVLRGSYGRYYQHPPLSTINGPLLEFALAQGFGFLPLKGERNEIWEVGLGIPIRGWTLDFSHFHNAARNVVDHQVLGNSNLLFPLAIANGRIRAWESTLRSPWLMRRVQLHWSFSNQTAQARGAVSGGLTDFQPPGNGYFYMDHDQRVTLVTGSEVHLPKRAWMSTTLIYGSGFLKGNGPEHMPQHAVVDISLGKDLGESWSVRATALNLGNNQFLTGLDSAFAGTHYSNPREISVQVRHRFHF